MIARMYSQGAAYGDNDKGTLPNRDLPPALKEAIKKPIIEIDPKEYFDRKGVPIDPNHERWGEWNADTDKLFAKKYPGFDAKEESAKLSRIGYYVLDNTPLAWTGPRIDEDDFPAAVDFLRKHWPDLAKTKKFSIHPRTEQWLKDPKRISNDIEEYGSQEVLEEQWKAVKSQLYGGTQ